MTITTGDNKFGVAKFIVDPVLGQGTHQTISAAYTSASSGDTIVVRPGTYTENPTVKPGTTLVAFNGDQVNPNVTIVGTCTMTGAGTSSISNIRLQTNSAFAVAVTGSAASILNLNNCYLNCTNNTGISFTASNTSARVVLNNCKCNLGTTGIAYFASSSTGTLDFRYSAYTNSGASTTVNTISAGTLITDFSNFTNPITISNATVGTCISSRFITSTNTTDITTSDTSVVTFLKCDFISGSASSISIGAGTSVTCALCNVSSSNTNAITGAGTLGNAGISFTNTSSLINTTTQTARNFDVGGISFNGGTDVLATYASGTFAPTIAFGGSSTGITYTNNDGKYTKIGRMVYCKIRITLSSKGAQVGTATLEGLPFTAETNTTLSIVPIGWTAITTTATYTSVGIQVASAGTNATFLQFSNTGLNAAVVTDAMFANTSAIFANFFYFAAS